MAREVHTPPRPWMCTASQHGVQPQGQYPNLPWPHSSQGAEPGGEPRQFILLTMPYPSYRVTLVKPRHLSGPLFVHPHTGCNTAYVAGLCRVKGGGVHYSLKGSGGLLGRSHSSPHLEIPQDSDSLPDTDNVIMTKRQSCPTALRMLVLSSPEAHVTTCQCLNHD